ncbi:hypothetical protein ACHAW5_001046 [Stephanodiscus triporus]|uniref:Uncharacterized protein n=1 Tax=Stephanodiscus triporus TaxID=2934178 RepID=A0ABD3MHW6_9STRA
MVDNSSLVSVARSVDDDVDRDVAIDLLVRGITAALNAEVVVARDENDAANSSEDVTAVDFICFCA